MVDAIASIIGALTDAVKLPCCLTRGDEQARCEHRDVHDSGFGFFVGEGERVLFHRYKGSRDAVRVKGFSLFSYDFFLPHTRLDPVEFDLVRAFRCPSFEHSQAKRGEGADRADLFGVFDDLCAGVVFLCHVYTLPRDGRKARDFFAIPQIIFVDKPLPIFEKIRTGV